MRVPLFFVLLPLALLACGQRAGPSAERPSAERLPQCVLPNVSYEGPNPFRDADRETWDSLEVALPQQVLGDRSYAATLGNGRRTSLVVMAAPFDEYTLVAVGEQSRCFTKDGQSGQVQTRSFMMSAEAWDDLDGCMVDSGFWELSPTFEPPDNLDRFGGVIRYLAGVREGERQQVYRGGCSEGQTDAAARCFLSLIEPLGIEGIGANSEETLAEDLSVPPRDLELEEARALVRKQVAALPAKPLAWLRPRLLDAPVFVEFRDRNDYPWSLWVFARDSAGVELALSSNGTHLFLVADGGLRSSKTLQELVKMARKTGGK